LSQQRLKVWAYDLLNPAHARELHEIFGFEALFFAIELERLNGRIKANLISILKAIGDCFLWTIDTNWNAVYVVCLDPMCEGLP
jgi:hypothetical protein